VGFLSELLVFGRQSPARQGEMTIEADLANPALTDSLWRRVRGIERIWYAVVAAIALFLVATSVVITPDPSGIGTATQLGLPPCGMLALTGRPCPTCGMTTAFALFAHGRVVDAILAQPLGAVLFVVVLFVGVLSAVFAAAGRKPRFLFARINWAAVVIFLVVAGVLSWTYKIWQLSK
jgi:hypothetical protein